MYLVLSHQILLFLLRNVAGYNRSITGTDIIMCVYVYVCVCMRLCVCPHVSMHMHLTDLLYPIAKLAILKIKISLKENEGFNSVKIIPLKARGMQRRIDFK